MGPSARSPFLTEAGRGTLRGGRTHVGKNAIARRRIRPPCLHELIETQCHGFDQLEHLCGPIESVMAEMTDQTGGGYRTMALALRFASGAVGSMTGTYDSSYAYQDSHRLEINGTQGRLVVEDTVRRFCFQNAGNETAEVWQAGYFNDFDREFHRTFDVHLDAIIDAFKRGDQPPIHARAGRRALQLAWAAVESFELGKRVRLAI